MWKLSSRSFSQTQILLNFTKPRTVSLAACPLLSERRANLKAIAVASTVYSCLPLYALALFCLLPKAGAFNLLSSRFAWQRKPDPA